MSRLAAFIIVLSAFVFGVAFSHVLFPCRCAKAQGSSSITIYMEPCPWCALHGIRAPGTDPEHLQGSFKEFFYHTGQALRPVQFEPGYVYVVDNPSWCNDPGEIPGKNGIALPILQKKW